MDAVAFTDPSVVSFIANHLVPVRVAADDPGLGPKYKVKWTPTLLLLDADGVEQSRTLGFYPPEELVPALLLGIGKWKFNLPDRPAAAAIFERIAADFPKSPAAPEAAYLAGVSRYIEGHDIGELIGIYDRIAGSWPASPWATRADPYRFLKKPAGKSAA
jgi:hypothetical protein